MFAISGSTTTSDENTSFPWLKLCSREHGHHCVTALLGSNMAQECNLTPSLVCPCELNAWDAEAFKSAQLVSAGLLRFVRTGPTLLADPRRFRSQLRPDRAG